MPITRIPTLTQLANRTDAANMEASVRNPLQIYSKSEVDAAIAAIDVSSQVAGISGALDARIDVLEATIPSITGGLASLNVEVDNVSAQAQIDIINLDVSLTDLIFNHIMINSGTPAVTGSINKWGKIENISGGPFFVPLYK
jgi:multidrug efflux pump subunit AcrA (membrane-fusion protein)